MFFHCDHGADGSAFARKRWLLAKGVFHRFGCGIRVLARELTAVGTERRFELNYDVAIVFSNEIPDQLENVFRVLIRNKAAADLGLGPIRDDRLHSWPLITAGDAV